MKLGVTLVSLAAIVGLTSSAVPAVASPSLGAGYGHTATQQAATSPGGWRDGGRISGRRGDLVMDGSTSHVLVAADTISASFDQPRAVSTIARRTPDGHWTRATAHIGEPVAIDVNAGGDAVIISTGSVDGGSVIATRWPRGADHFRSRVVLKAADAPDLAATSVAANGHGDIAVLVSPYSGYGDRVLLLRKPSGKHWKRTLTIARPQYGGALDSVDITPTGAVVGAFKQNQTLSVRTLLPGNATFGRSTEVTTWPAIDDDPGDYSESYATVEVGVNGDFATTWAYGVLSPEGGSELITTRLNIVPTTGRPWQRQFERGDSDIDVVSVARDGSVLFEDEINTRRWNRDTRQLTGRETAFFKDANVRGDGLIGGGIYRGPLRLWPVGKVRGPEVQPPRGDLYSAVLTDDHRVYAAFRRDDAAPPAYYLSIRQF